MGPSLGTLLATGVVAVATTQTSSEEFLAWGWRLPFLLSGALVAFGLWVRIGVEETPSFQQLAREDAKASAPVAEVFSEHWRRLLIAAGARVGPDVLYSLTAVFALAYLTTTLGVERSEALIALSIGGVCNALAIPLFGSMSDRFGRRRVYGAGVLCALVLAFAFFPLLETASFPVIAFALAAALTVQAMMYGPQAAFITEQFPTRVRYAGSSLAYTLAGVLGGGIAPLMFASLQRAYGATTPLAIYLVVALLVTAVALTFARGGTADGPLHRG
jgi:MFS family permease